MEKGVILYAPNSFTPDGNQYNPVFLPIVTSGVDKNQHELEVFNPWGEVVFKTTEAEEGWDVTYKGIACKEGVYRDRLRTRLHQVMKKGSSWDT